MRSQSHQSTRCKMRSQSHLSSICDLNRTKPNTIVTPQPQNMLLPLSPWHNNLTMTSRFWGHFLPTYANCHPSVDRAQRALLANVWQLAKVGQNGRQETFARAVMQGCWAPPLSIVDNIKINFINNTHYFKMRFYMIIKLY